MKSKTAHSLLFAITILLAAGCASTSKRTKSADNDNVLDEMPTVIKASNNQGHMYP